VKGQSVIDESNPQRFFAQIPNIVFSLSLSPFELSLYCHLKRTAGADGTSWKSTETLAKETGMSMGMVSKAKTGLATPRPQLNLKPLVLIAKDETKPGRPRDIITIVDIWKDNFAFFQNQTSPGELQTSPHEVQSSYSEVQTSPGERKNNPSRKTPEEEKTKPSGLDAKASRAGKGKAREMKHEAANLYSRIMGSNPKPVQREAIESQVTDFARWESVLRQLALEGRDPRRVDWALERYRGDSPRQQARGSTTDLLSPDYVMPETVWTVEELMNCLGLTREQAQERWEREFRTEQAA
jgi:hypothetical protein